MSAVLPPLEILKTCARNALAEERETVPETKLSACYEALAREFGMRDWNTLRAAAGQEPAREFDPNDIDKGQVWLAICNPYRSVGHHTPWDLGRQVVVTDVTTSHRNKYIALRHAAGSDEWEIAASNFVKGFYLVQDTAGAHQPVRVGQTWMAVRNPFKGVMRRFFDVRWTLGLEYTITSIDREANKIRFNHVDGDAIFDTSVDAFSDGFVRYREPDPVEAIVDRLTMNDAVHLLHLVVDEGQWGEMSGAAGEMALRQRLVEIVVDAVDPDYAQVALTSRGREAVALLRQRAWVEDRDFGDRTELLPVHPWPGAEQASL